MTISYWRKLATPVIARVIKEVGTMAERDQSPVGANGQLNILETRL